MALLERYESFLLSNAAQITGVESSLRSITWILPGRFKDAELAGEAVYAALNLLGMYHDSILVRLLSPPKVPSALGKPLPSPALQGSTAAGLAPAPPATYTHHQHTPSSHARYTHHFSDSSPSYRVVARTLVIIGYLELLAEMVARRKLGRKEAWNVVAGIEGAKAALRLTLLQLTRGHPTIQPPIPEREVDPAMLEEDRTNAMAALAAPGSAEHKSGGERLPDSLLLDGRSQAEAGKEYWRGARTGYTRPTLASLRAHSQPGSQKAGTASPRSGSHPTSRPPHPLARARSATRSVSGSDSDETLVEPWTEKEVTDYLLSRTLTPTDVRRPEELVRPTKGGVGKLAEILWILRPLLYVLAIRRWGTRHKTPFLLSFLLEYLARFLRIRSLSSPSSAPSSMGLSNPLMLALLGENPLLGLAGGAGSPGDARPTSDVEGQEWAKRDRSFWWYLLRGPVWYEWTRPKLSSVITRTENRPLLGLVAGIVRDYLPLVDEYYFYSAT